MVKLSYAFKLKASYQQVWNYFSNFQNIEHYDPCVKTAQIIKNTPNRIGSSYDVTTLFNGNEGKMIYTVTKYREDLQNGLRKNMIQIIGQNQKIKSIDQIHLTQLSKSQTGYNLYVEYKADMNFKGVYWFATPFVTGALNKIAEEAEKGMKLRCIQNWGQDSLEPRERKSLSL